MQGSNTARVRVQVQIGPAQEGMSQDDQAMSRAIEASLSYNMTEDTFEELSLEDKVRKGDT